MSLQIVSELMIALGGVGIIALAGLALTAGSRTLLRDVIGDARLADAIASLVNVGFLLLDFGFVALFASASVDGGTPAALLQAVLGRLGWLLIVVATTHLMALVVLSGIRSSVHARHAREIRDEAWAIWNREMRSHQR